MSGPRSACPVLTCNRDMPRYQVMCAYCWAKVPRDIRKQLDGAQQPSARRSALIERAIATAQGEPS